jgi:hypothetical protein
MVGPTTINNQIKVHFEEERERDKVFLRVRTVLKIVVSIKFKANKF